MKSVGERNQEKIQAWELFQSKKFGVVPDTLNWLEAKTFPGCAFVLSCFNCAWFCATLWTVAHQAPLSMGFSRQESWRGLPCPPPGYLPHPGIEPKSLTSPALTDGFFTISITWEVHTNCRGFSLSKKPNSSTENLWHLLLELPPDPQTCLSRKQSAKTLHGVYN